MTIDIAAFSILDAEGWLLVTDADSNEFAFRPGAIVRITPPAPGAAGCRFQVAPDHLEFAFPFFNVSDFARSIHVGVPAVTPRDAADVDLVARTWGGPYAAGAPIADAGPFPTFSPTRVPRIVLGPGGVAGVVYTLVGTSIGPSAGVITEVFPATPAGGVTLDATQAFATITNFSSDIDPGDVTTLEAYNTRVFPAATNIYVGVTGTIQMGLFGDTPIRAWQNIEGGNVIPLGVNRVNIDGTTAASIKLLFSP